MKSNPETRCRVGLLSTIIMMQDLSVQLLLSFGSFHTKVKVGVLC